MSARLIGGISRDVTGQAGAPLRFYLTVDRGLRSGKLDTVEVDEAKILELVASGAAALKMLAEPGRRRPSR